VFCNLGVNELRNLPLDCCLLGQVLLQTKRSYSLSIYIWEFISIVGLVFKHCVWVKDHQIFSVEMERETDKTSQLKECILETTSK